MTEQTDPCLTRRDVFRWGLACGATCVLSNIHPILGAEADLDRKLSGPNLDGVVRHEAMFWEKINDREVKCRLCPRECRVADVERGYCGVRENQGGNYQTLVYGTLCSLNVDPIEKKPLFHYLPGTPAVSVATAGCNIECKFCQNWQISQFRPEQVPSTEWTPQQLVSRCKSRGYRTIAYTYSEPVVYYEYMHDVAALARKERIGSVMISNGYIQEEPLRQLCRHLTAVKVDLKAFTETFYKEQCMGELRPVLESLKVIKQMGTWLEIVVLIIPTLNDSADEIKKMSEWVTTNLGQDVPMHFTRFHPTYRIKNLPSTPVETLEKCRSIALSGGVHYAYAGNVAGHQGENTYCHSCKRMLIRRFGFRVTENRISNGLCPDCGTTIPGVWMHDNLFHRESDPKPLNAVSE